MLKSTNKRLGPQIMVEDSADLGVEDAPNCGSPKNEVALPQRKKTRGNS